MLRTRVLKRIEEAIGSKRDALASGGCADIAEYKRICGMIYGLKEASDIFLAEMKKEVEEE